jgi:bifunctional DNA-binding transcriptional regulator/antitoxin component of YhaV-PrlF toxin-antitoxin module
MRITSKGQVTIPQALLSRFGLLPETEVEFIEDVDGLRLVKIASKRPDRADRALGLLRGSAEARLTTDQIMDLTRGE